MNVWLSKHEKEYLLSHGFFGMPVPLANAQPGRGTHLDIDDKTAALLREKVADRLQEVGFDKDRDYELTTEGRMLETLIDKLFVP